MSENFDIYVNCISGDDKKASVDKLIPYKTLDSALDDAKIGDRFFIDPGTYSGFSIESDSENLNPFEYSVNGTGKNVILNEVEHKNCINCYYKDVRIRDLDFQCLNSDSTFENVFFVGNHKMILRSMKHVNGAIPNNEITFLNCHFGINFQIFSVSGIYKLTFKNCTFKSISIPFIFADNGDIEINLTSCNFDTNVVECNKCYVTIYYTSCIFKKPIWIGNECMTYAAGDEILTVSGLKSVKSSPGLYKEQFQVVYKQEKHEINELYKAIKFDTHEMVSLDLKPELELKPETEFVHIVGKYPATIFLPNTNLIQNGHRIEILNNSTQVIIGELKYSDRIITIRHVINNGWVFF